ncbi:DUF3488 domain-containing protein [Psychromonas sp. psych-6C06]|uniref:transglutaminase family protein n=1 Tax=Psychromonas sp. psych-6C06 TaxID=2058089 RepID=UPI000C32C7D5|nr:DUF3488 and transglutaminase-like domain-containing protein [Psychromonas sp. psych-6C06]PKF63810.1 DUF3488 domain-containing protein [Psychromonas sp. psych-6C06]
MKDFLSRFNLTLIICSYLALVFTLYDQLHAIILLIGLGAASWRLGHYFGKVPLLNIIMLAIVSIICAVFTVLLLYKQGLFNILIHLVFLGFSLKFLELRSVRDVYFFVNTGLVLIALFFIFNTSIYSAFIATLLILLLLSVLLSLHAQALLKSEFVKLLLKSCVISLPLAILLFLVMPRLPTLWKMPIQKQATTGLSDSVTPGEIANLSRSSALAFRATFTAMPPIESERYWRALTLDSFDGRTWSQSGTLKAQEMEAKRGVGQRFSANNASDNVNNDYELIIEPHYNYWIPVLDYAKTPQQLVSLSDYSLRSDKPIITRKGFTISSLSSVQPSPLTTFELQQYTQLPESTNPKTDNWISENLNNGVSRENLLTQLLTGFTQRFTYTLQPPLLAEQQVDDFLFNRQAGFCVHYASSYLYVARKLGFPARMVTGYLGGQWQASEGFFTVRQYDAHAWVEIWKNDAWQRVDPTAYVAPERVESGLEQSLTDSNEFLADEYFSLQRWQSVPLLDTLRARLAQLDYLWARYVVNFDNQKQQKLLQRWLNLIPWLNIAYSVLAVMGIIFIALLLSIFKPWQKIKFAPEDVIYNRLQQHYKNRYGERGIRKTGQSISDYCKQLSQNEALNSTLFNKFASCYNNIKYAPQADKISYRKNIKQLKTIYQLLRKTRGG